MEPALPVTKHSDFVEMAARRKAGASPTWHISHQRFAIGGTVVTGAEYPETITRGPNKGRHKWSSRVAGSESLVVVTDEDIQAEKAAWEGVYGRCCDCFGSGRQPVGYSTEKGPKLRACQRCGGSGKAPGSTTPKGDTTMDNAALSALIDRVDAGGSGLEIDEAAGVVSGFFTLVREPDGLVLRTIDNLSDAVWTGFHIPPFSTSQDAARRFTAAIMEKTGHPLWTVKTDFRHSGAHGDFATVEITVPSREFQGSAGGEHAQARAELAAALRVLQAGVCGD